MRSGKNTELSADQLKQAYSDVDVLLSKYDELLGKLTAAAENVNASRSGTTQSPVDSVLAVIKSYTAFLAVAKEYDAYSDKLIPLKDGLIKKLKDLQAKYQAASPSTRESLGSMDAGLIDLINSVEHLNIARDKSLDLIIKISTETKSYLSPITTKLSSVTHQEGSASGKVLAMLNKLTVNAKPFLDQVDQKVKSRVPSNYSSTSSALMKQPSNPPAATSKEEKPKEKKSKSKKVPG
jgi:hypothetical protein